MIADHILAARYATHSHSNEGGADLRQDTLVSAFENLWRSFDRVHGGWGDGPKFPQPMALEFLLRYHHRTSDTLALKMVAQSLEAMARGGMYDQLGGGFHRYSVDDHWLVLQRKVTKSCKLLQLSFRCET